MEKVIKFGIIGCGLISRVHAAAIAGLPQATLVGVADNNPERAVSFAEQYGVRAYENTTKLLEDPQIDIVCICTPSGFHAEGAQEALRYGKHVVLEKPMALTTESAKAVVELCKQHNRLLTVISQWRFAPSFVYAKQLLEEKKLGNLVMCSLRMKYWRDPTYYTESPWHGTKKFDGGGALMNQGIHGIDLLQYLIGNATVLKGRAKTMYHNIEVEDTAAALLEFENGALGVIEASTCTYPGFDRRWEIHGDRGYMIMQEDSIRELMIDGAYVDVPKLESAAISSAADPGKLEYKNHAAQLQNLMDAICGKATLRIGAEDGYWAVKLIEDVYISSEQLD